MIDPDDPFSDSALAAAVKKLPDLPAAQVTLGAVAQNGDVGIELEGNKQLGKGWFVEGDASWWRKAGYTVAAMIGWKGGSK